jgi:membrane protein
MSTRPLLRRLRWTLRDYAKRVWDNAGEDNIFFLAGGIAFNILLAAVPFVLLLLSGLGYLLDRSTAASSAEVWEFIDRFLPPQAENPNTGVRGLLNDIIQTRGPVGLFGLIGFVWFSTRLFGSLRTVLGEVFDIEQGRSIIGGKLFDIQITVVAMLLFVVYTTLSAYLRIARSRGVQMLQTLGLRTDLLGGVEYYLGSAIAFAFIVFMFFALYKFLPDRRIRWKPALVAAVFTSTLFEIAKNLFTTYLTRFDPGSLYTGTLYALVIFVFWVYYSALIFILGGEVGQVFHLRRVQRKQRETFED